MESDQGTEISSNTGDEAVQCTLEDSELKMFNEALDPLGGKIAKLNGKIFAEFQSGYKDLVDYVARSANELDEDDGVFRAVFLGCAVTYIKVLGIDDIDNTLLSDVDRRMEELERMH